MKILVTGATGFIGHYVINEILKLENHTIIATGIEKEEELGNKSWLNKCKYISCDLNQSKQNYFTFFKNHW